MPSIRIGAYQGGCERGVDNNVDLIETVLTEATAKNLDLVVFCETFLHGYCAGSLLREKAETQQGSSFQRISKLAAKHKIGVVYGYSERESEESSVVYNSCLFIGKDGSLLANYRKTHLWGDYEKSFFTPGSEFLAPFEFEGIKISMLICFDIEFPEPARLLALKGAQLLIVPTALTGGTMSTITVPSRALENHCFIVYANRSGDDIYAPTNEKTTFCGSSVIVGPNGLDLARASKQNSELITAVIDTTDPLWQEDTDRNPYMTSRRTDLYSITLN